MGIFKNWSAYLLFKYAGIFEDWTREKEGDVLSHEEVCH